MSWETIPRGKPHALFGARMSPYASHHLMRTVSWNPWPDRIVQLTKHHEDDTIEEYGGKWSKNLVHYHI